MADQAYTRLGRAQIATFATSPAAVQAYEDLQAAAFEDGPEATQEAQDAADLAIAASVDAQAAADAATAAVAGKEPAIAAGTTAQYWRGDKSWQTLNKAAVGLGSVDNTADAAKNVLSATKLTTARTINGVSFDGTANIVVPGSTISVVTKTAGYTETATSGELVILADLAAGFTIVLPTAVGNSAKITVKKMQAAGSIIVDGSGAQTIDGGLTATLTSQYEAITIVSDNANWWII